MLQRSPHRDCGYDNTGVGIHCIEISGEHMTIRGGIARISRQQGRITYGRPKPCVFIRRWIEKIP